VRYVSFGLVIAFIAVAAVYSPGRLSAEDDGKGSPRRTLTIGDNPNPVIWGQHSSPYRDIPGQTITLSSPYGGFIYGYESSGCGLNYGYNYYGGWPYSGYYSGVYAPYWLGSSNIGPFTYPPLVVPPSTFYGPQVNGNAFIPSNTSLPAVGSSPFREPDNEGQNADSPAAKVLERGTNAKALATAKKYIGYGDALFAKGNWLAANERYRRAAENAPQLADAYFRQGFALAATGRYELAVAAFKRGLKLNSKWPESPFRLRQLYGDDVAAQTAHLNAIAKAAEKSPQDPTPLFLVGVYLYFDGQTNRAEAFFHRALELAGDDADHIRPFQPK
jgi:hypothetical protein